MYKPIKKIENHSKAHRSEYINNISDFTTDNNMYILHYHLLRNARRCILQSIYFVCYYCPEHFKETMEVNNMKIGKTIKPNIL